MSAGTTEVLQPEAGDDRQKEAEIAKLNEIYNAPTADTIVGYESDVRKSSKAALGELVIVDVNNKRNGIPPRLGLYALGRRVHISPIVVRK